MKQNELFLRARRPNIQCVLDGSKVRWTRCMRNEQHAIGVRDAPPRPFGCIRVRLTDDEAARLLRPIEQAIEESVIAVSARSRTGGPLRACQLRVEIDGTAKA